MNLVEIKTRVVTAPKIVNDPFTVSVDDNETVIGIDWDNARPFVIIYTARDIRE